MNSSVSGIIVEIKTIVYKHAWSVCYSSCDFIKNAFVLQLIFAYVVCGVMKLKISVIGFVKSGNMRRFDSLVVLEY